MRDLRRQIEAASQIATLLGYLAPRMEPGRVVALVDYLGDLVDPWVAALLQPHFGFQKGGDPAPGMQALRVSLEALALPAGPQIASVTSEQSYSVAPGVENAIADTVFGDTPLLEAAEALLQDCSDPVEYASFNARVTLPYDLKFLPRRAVSRASVFLRVVESARPDLHALQYFLVNLLCQANLKLCRFAECAEEAERFLQRPSGISHRERSFLQTFRGMALEGLGELAPAREALAQAVEQARSSGEDDTSDLCLALTEIYRLGVETGDMTDLPAAGGLLFQNRDRCDDINVRYTTLSFLAILQAHLGRNEAAEQISRSVVMEAREARALEVESDARNQWALLLWRQRRRDEAAALLAENLPLLALSGHAWMAARTEALIHQTTSRDAPFLPGSLPAAWQESLPAPHRMPALAGVHILAGRARQHALADRFEGARQVIAAVRACESVRRLVREGQEHRFLAQFCEVYRLFLDLPVQDHIPAEEHADILRAVIGLFERAGIQRDEHLARALLQLHHAREARTPAGADRISELILEAVLDPDHVDTHLELAQAWLETGDLPKAWEACERALDLDPGDPRAGRLLNLIEQRRREGLAAAPTDDDEAMERGEGEPPLSLSEAPAPAPRQEDRRGALEDPSSYRSCSRCGRMVHDLTFAQGDKKGVHVIDSGLALISGTTCGGCGSFFCVYPCSLRGDEAFLRLCPACRHFLVGVLGDEG